MEWFGKPGQRKAVSGSLGDLALVAMEGVRPRGDLVRSSELVVSVIELVDRLVMSVCEYRGLGIMGVHIMSLLWMVFMLDVWRDVLRHGVEMLLFLDRAGTT